MVSSRWPGFFTVPAHAACTCLPTRFLKSANVSPSATDLSSALCTSATSESCARPATPKARERAAAFMLDHVGPSTGVRARKASTASWKAGAEGLPVPSSGLVMPPAGRLRMQRALLRYAAPVGPGR